MTKDMSRLIKTVYEATEKALDHSLFEPNAQDEMEFAIHNVALSFDNPNFLAVTVAGKKYLPGNKMDFIDDMRMHFADNPKFVIDGMFEYKIIPTPAYIPFIMRFPKDADGKRFAEAVEI